MNLIETLRAEYTELQLAKFGAGWAARKVELRERFADFSRPTKAKVLALADRISEAF